MYKFRLQFGAINFILKNYRLLQPSLDNHLAAARHRVNSFQSVKQTIYSGSATKCTDQITLMANQITR